MENKISGFLDLYGDGVYDCKHIRPFVIEKHDDGSWKMFIGGQPAADIESLSDIVNEFGDLYYKSNSPCLKDEDIMVWDQLFDDNGLNHNSSPCMEEDE